MNTIIPTLIKKKNPKSLTEDHLFWRDCVGSLGKLVKILELVIFHELGTWRADRLALSNLCHKSMILYQIWVHCPLSDSLSTELFQSPSSLSLSVSALRHLLHLQSKPLFFVVICETVKLEWKATRLGSHL